MGNGGVTVKIEGLEDVRERLKNFGEEFLRKGVKDALRAGGEVLRKAISVRAPRSMDVTHGHPPGFLADHIGSKVSVSTKSDKGEILVGPVKKAFWGMFAEFGTKNQPALPFVRPAFEESAETALDAFTAKMKEAFTEVAK